jgi:hypothetical protein
MEGQPIHARNHIKLYTKAADVNMWLGNGCVVVAEMIPPVTTYLNLLKPYFTIFENFYIVESTIIESKLL